MRLAPLSALQHVFADSRTLETRRRRARSRPAASRAAPSCCSCATPSPPLGCTAGIWSRRARTDYR
eukprot:1506183-Prymnesium_polylepis.1